MPIVYPRPLPPGIATQGFRLKRSDYAAPENSGRIGGVSAGWPRWTANWGIGNTTRAQADAIESWLDSLRGMQKTLLGRDLRRPFPLAYPTGFASTTTVAGAPFGGAAASWSQSIDSEGSCDLTLTGLPAGLVLGDLDYIGFKWDGEGSSAGSDDRRALVRIVHGGGNLADSTGEVTVTVEPTVPDWVPVDAVAHLDQPCCLMKLTVESQISDTDRRLRIRGSRIAAVQVLMP